MGNITELSLNGYSLTYDAENRMKAATTPSGVTQYSYDGEGRRVKKVVGATATIYVYDAQGSLAAEYGTANEGGVQYLTADHLGSTRLVTGAWGIPVRCYDYLPFGEELKANEFGRDALFPTGLYPSGLDALSQQFTGKERDAETGLDYFLARYFSGAQGRFTSADPFNPNLEFQPESDDEEDVEDAREKFNQYLSEPQNWNRYVYTFNNPLRYIDADGEAVPLILYPAGTAIAAAIASPAGQRALIASSNYLARYGPQVQRVLAASGQRISSLAFQLGPAVRGRLIETLRGASEAFRNVEVIDKFSRGIATSIKSRL